MKWCIHKGVDGVISDDPKRFLEICESYGGEKVKLPLKAYGFMVFVYVAGPILGPIFTWLRRRAARRAKNV